MANLITLIRPSAPEPVESPTNRRWKWYFNDPISPSDAPVVPLTAENPESLVPWSDDEEDPSKLIIEPFFTRSVEEAGRQNFSGMTQDEKRALRDQIESLALICRFWPEHYFDVRAAYKIPRRQDIIGEQMKLAEFQRKISMHGMSPRVSLSHQFEYWSYRATLEKGAKLGDKAMAFSEKRVIHKKSLRTPMTGRYECTIRHFMPPFSRDLVKTEFTICLDDGRTFAVNDGESYIVQYPDPRDPENSIPLTANLTRSGVLPGVEYPLWLHVDPEHIPILIRHLDHLYFRLQDLGRQMMANPMEDAKTEDAKKTFLRQLSHVYWLASHLTLTCRGNGQNCLNFLYREMKVHGLLPLIPKVGCLPDCIALSTPLRVFQEHFLTLFEPEKALARLFEQL